MVSSSQHVVDELSACLRPYEFGLQLRISVSANAQSVVISRQPLVLKLFREVVAALLFKDDPSVFQERVQVVTLDAELPADFRRCEAVMALAVQFFESVGDDLVGLVEHFFFID